ncbi:MAG: hypothetical protein ABSE90_11990 [Verrucomicrobiota bacterium]
MPLPNNIQTIPTPIFYLAGHKRYRGVQEPPGASAVLITGGLVYTQHSESIADAAILTGAIIGGYCPTLHGRAVAEIETDVAGQILNGEASGPFQRDGAEYETNIVVAVAGGFVYTPHTESITDGAGSAGAIIDGSTGM